MLAAMFFKGCRGGGGGGTAAKSLAWHDNNGLIVYLTNLSDFSMVCTPIEH